MSKWCQHCDERQKTRTDGEFLFCAVCGSNLGPKRSSVSIQFL